MTTSPLVSCTGRTTTTSAANFYSDYNPGARTRTSWSDYLLYCPYKQQIGNVQPLTVLIWIRNVAHVVTDDVSSLITQKAHFVPFPSLQLCTELSLPLLHTQNAHSSLGKGGTPVFLNSSPIFLKLHPFSLSSDVARRGRSWVSKNVQMLIQVLCKPAWIPTVLLTVFHQSGTPGLMGPDWS